MTQLLATMPVLPLTFGCMVKFEAIDPTTGVAVANVKVSTAEIYAVELVGSDVEGLVGPFMLVPGPGAGGGSG